MLDSINTTIIIGMFIALGIWLAIKAGDILISRYFPKFLDKTDVIFVNIIRNIRSFFRKLQKEDILIANYRNLKDSQGNIQVDKLEWIESNVFNEELIDFAIEYQVPSIIVSCLSEPNNLVKIKSLHILEKFAQKKGPQILIDSEAIPKLISLLGDPDNEIRKRSKDLLQYIGVKGRGRILLGYITGKEEKLVAISLVEIYHRLFSVRPPEEFLDEVTIQPLLNFLTFFADPYNILASLVDSARKGLFSLKQIIDAGKINLFKQYLEKGEWDVRIITLSLFIEFTKHGESVAIASNGFIPIIINNLKDSPDEIKQNAEILIKLGDCVRSTPNL